MDANIAESTQRACAVRPSDVRRPSPATAARIRVLKLPEPAHDAQRHGAERSGQRRNDELRSGHEEERVVRDGLERGTDRIDSRSGGSLAVKEHDPQQCC